MDLRIFAVVESISFVLSHLVCCHSSFSVLFSPTTLQNLEYVRTTTATTGCLQYVNIHSSIVVVLYDHTTRIFSPHVNSKTLNRLFQSLSKMIKLTERMSVPNLVKFCERWSSGQKEEIHIFVLYF